MNLIQQINAIYNRVHQPGIKVSKNFRVNAYWHIGRLLEAEINKQPGQITDPKTWINQLIKPSDQSIRKGLLKTMHQFYQAFPDWSLIKVELTWGHYCALLKVTDTSTRMTYMALAAQNHWSVTELRRQIGARHVERQGELSLTSSNNTPAHPMNWLKDNYILEFTGLDTDKQFKEHELEDALLDQLQHFLMELGTGFSFVARQKRIVTETGKPFFIDLVFYHFILKRFVLVELKVTDLSHRDIGQIDMYVRLYDDKWKGKADQPTIGIVLCPTKDPTIEKYSLVRDSPQVFAATYEVGINGERKGASDFYVDFFHNALLKEFPVTSPKS